MIQAKKGFTLIECLVVVAVLAILTTLAFPHFDLYFARLTLESDSFKAYSTIRKVYTKVLMTESEYRIFPRNDSLVVYDASGQFSPKLSMGFSRNISISHTRASIANTGIKMCQTFLGFGRYSCTIFMRSNKLNNSLHYEITFPPAIMRVNFYRVTNGQRVRAY